MFKRLVIHTRPLHSNVPKIGTQRKPVLESLEARRVLSSDWTNPDQRLDVSADRWVGPLDALIIINRLQERANGSEGSLLGERGIAPFVDVNGDAAVSPLDALIVINSLNDAPPLVFTMLTTDTAAGGGTNNDRITANASINGWIQNAKSKDRIYVGWDITDDSELKDITNTRVRNNFALSEESITQLLGQPLSSGSHTLTIVLKRDAVERFRSSFTFVIDRNAT